MAVRADPQGDGVRDAGRPRRLRSATSRRPLRCPARQASRTSSRKRCTLWASSIARMEISMLRSRLREALSLKRQWATVTMRHLPPEPRACGDQRGSAHTRADHAARSLAIQPRSARGLVGQFVLTSRRATRRSSARSGTRRAILRSGGKPARDKTA
jgi:hypothetical protein